jgi:tape measure domain-containing protein
MASNDVIVRLRMMGAAIFKSAADSAAKGVRGIGEAATDSGKAASRFSGLLDKASGPLTALGTLSTRAGVALGVAGGAAVGMGLKFNAGMEQSTVAFTNLLGNADEAQAMLDRLYKIAAKTPFEFPQLTQSTQRLLGFGMAAKDVIPTMQAVGDAVAAAGGGAEQIDRVSTALGQIQAKGKVSSEELLQLAESGVPALKILGDQLGLTGAQLSKKLQKGAVDAKTGIDALVTGIEKRYGGMAAAQSKTFSGMMSTLKDNATQILGEVTMPLFTFLRDKVLPTVNDVADAFGKWVKAGGIIKAMRDLQSGFDPNKVVKGAGLGGEWGARLFKIGLILGKVFRGVRGYVVQFLDALKPLQPFLSNILFPLLKGFAIGVLGSVIGSLKILIPIIRVLATALGWIGQKAAPLRPWFERLGIVLGVVFGPTVLRAISMLGKFGGVFRIVAAAARLAYAPIAAVNRLFGLFGRTIARVAPAVARGVASIWPKVREGFQKILDGAKSFGGRLISSIVNGIRDHAGDVLNALVSLVPGGGIAKRAIRKVLGMADGGTVTRGGSFLVGERGPELVNLNRGARVLPNAALPVAAMASSAFSVTVPVYMDGRNVTTVVANRTATAAARR